MLDRVFKELLTAFDSAATLGFGIIVAVAMFDFAILRQQISVVDLVGAIAAAALPCASPIVLQSLVGDGSDTRVDTLLFQVSLPGMDKVWPSSGLLAAFLAPHSAGKPRSWERQCGGGTWRPALSSQLATA